MSGPKVTVYTLTEEELLAIREELLHEQEELLRRKDLLDDWKHIKDELTEQAGLLPEIEQRLDEGQDWVKDEGLRRRVKAMKTKIATLLQRLGECINLEDNDMLDDALLEIQVEMTELEGELPEIQRESVLLKKRLERVLGKEVTDLFDGASLDSSSPAQQEEEHTAFMDDSVKELLDLQENPFLPPSCRKEVEHAISRMKMANENRQLVAFCSIELPDVLKDCRTFLSLWNKDGENYRKLCRSYAAWKKRNGSQDIEIIPFEAGAVDRLETLIRAEEEKAQAAAEQKYIQETLTEVMQDMGYDVLGARDVTKRSGKHFRNELYQYGEDTAVNVTYADDGQISMELGKIDIADRVPTKAEGAYLESQMVHFCDRFKELEARMQEKGIKIGKRIALAPPTADYAQIINKEDYEMQDRMQNADRTERRKTASPKALHYTDG